MNQQAPGALPTWQLRPPIRRIVVRFAEVVCPPELRTGDVIEGLLAEFESLLGASPAVVRRLVPGGLIAFDQGARLYPRSRGRRFTRMADADADAYFRAVLARRRGGLASSLQRLKGLVVMCYYELPQVKEQLGYRPDSYIAQVSRRRLETYGAQIRAGEGASLRPDPETEGAAASPGRPEER